MVFTDLVDSTALAQSLGDHAADEVRRTHFELLRKAVASTGGTEVKTIGDALMASYTSAADAIDGAVAMQQNVDAHNRTVEGPRMAMRIGMSAGDATFEDGDWFGTPVVEASRLCGAAEGDQILLTEIVRALAGSRSEHTIESVGEVQAKGLADPLQACEVRWAPLDVGGGDVGALQVPLPAAVDQVETFGFAGREAELVTVVDQLKAAMTGERRAVLISGEPGIGKTRLVRETCRRAHHDGAVVLWGACDDELGIPFQPFAEAFGRLIHAMPSDQVAALLGPLGGELVRLVPDIDQLVPGLADPQESDPDSERYRLFEAAREFVVSIASRSPVVLVLDDLHWAGKPTLLLLRHLLRDIADVPLLLVITYRDTDLDRTHPLSDVLADLRRESGVTRLALTGLGEDELFEFMERTAGHSLGDEARGLAGALHEETEGNPFFVGEVLRHLAETGALVQEDGRWVGAETLTEVGIPEGVREVVGRRLSTLDESTNAVLTIAAAVGREFDVGLLAAIAPGDQDEVLDALEAAEASGLLESSSTPGLYRFSHALVRTTLYEELTTTKRLRVHRDIANALADRSDANQRLPEVARHFSECAALGEVDRAIDWCGRAGQAAMEDLAWEEAALHFGRALDALDIADEVDPTLRCDLLTEAGRARLRMADGLAEDLLFGAAAIAIELGDSDRLCEVVVTLNESRPTRNMGTINEDMIELVDRALDIATDDRQRAQLLAAKAYELLWQEDPEPRRAMSDEAVELARRSGDREVLSVVLGKQFANTDSMMDASAAGVIEAASEVEQLAVEMGDKSGLCSALLIRAPLSICHGDRVGGDDDLRRAVVLADELHHPAAQHRCMVLDAAGLLLSGRLDEAEERIAEHNAFGIRHGFNDSSASQMYRLHYERGTLLELEPLLTQLVEDQPAIPAWRVALIGALTTNDRDEEARVHIAAMAADDFAMVRRDGLWTLTIAGLARTAGITGQLDIAQRALDNLSDRTDLLAFTYASYEQPVALSVGTAAMALGRFDDADRLFAQALDLSERADAPTYVAVTKTQWAESHLLADRPGAVDTARTLAADALATAERLGLGRVEVLSRRILDQVGA